MVNVKSCKSCGVSVELNAVCNKDNSKVALKIDKCPLCGEALVDDDSENYEGENQ